MDIGLKLDKLFEGTGQGLHFESCKVGIETTNNNTGFFALLDSTAKNTNILWNAAASPSAQGSMILENVQVDDSVPSVSVLAYSVVLMLAIGIFLLYTLIRQLYCQYAILMVQLYIVMQ